VFLASTTYEYISDHSDYGLDYTEGSRLLNRFGGDARPHQYFQCDIYESPYIQ